MDAPRLAPVALLLALVVPAGTRADDCYYMMVFGAQRPGVNQPKYAHSFATFVHVGAGGFHAFTISWLPRSLDIDLLRALPEPGVNLDLYATLGYVMQDGCRVSVWGPYQIRPELFARAIRQREHLESGEVRYKAVDTGFPAARTSNCIHAVSDLAQEERRLRIASPGWGEPASFFITLQLQAWIIEPEVTYDWVGQQLGLGYYPLLVRRTLDDNPAEGAVMRAMQAVEHRVLLRGPRRYPQDPPACCAGGR